MVIKSEHITDEEMAAINQLLGVLKKKTTRNKIRQRYYDGKLTVKNLNIALPPKLAAMSRSTIGWGAKAVNSLAVRSRFDGFVYKGLEEDPLADVIRDNNFYDLYRQATISELTNSCAFITISAGEEDEPPVVFNFYAATKAAATWNAREKRIKNGVVITAGEPSLPDGFIFYTNDAIIECKKETLEWNVERTDHDYGRPLMEALVYNPSLEKPFGTSRISRAVMSIIDRALRTIVRMDIAAEFFTAPQKYLLGADKDVLDGKSKFDTYIDSIFGATKDEEGDTPAYGQLPQGQLTPLTDQFRALAAEFSGETSIPVSSLGIIHDNPASAEGIYATKEDLIMVAENLNTTNGNALRNIGMLALMILSGKPSANELPEAWKSIMPKFKSPARPSVVSQSDAIIKQVSAIPWIAETDVALEELGYSEDQIIRMKAQQIDADAATTFLEMAGNLNEATNTDGS